MGTGLISILLSVAYVKLVGVKTPEEFRNQNTTRTPGKVQLLPGAVPLHLHAGAAPRRAVRLPGAGRRTALP